MGKKHKKTSTTLHSDKFTLNQTILPQLVTYPKESFTAFYQTHPKLYKVCKDKFPELFNLNVIISMFQAWVSFENKGKPSEVKRLLTGKPNLKYLVPYEGLDWKTDVFQNTTLIRGNEEITETHIKFANDGFLYSETSEMTTVKEKINRYLKNIFINYNILKRHGSENWSLLDKSVYEDTFKVIIDWADEFFGSQTQTQFFYCTELEHIDLKFKPTGNEYTDALIITFEPGYPEGEFVDVWQ